MAGTMIRKWVSYRALPSILQQSPQVTCCPHRPTRSVSSAARCHFRSIESSAAWCRPSWQHRQQACNAH